MERINAEMSLKVRFIACDVCTVTHKFASAYGINYDTKWHSQYLGYLFPDLYSSITFSHKL